MIYTDTHKTIIREKDGKSHKHYGIFYSYISKKFIHLDVN